MPLLLGHLASFITIVFLVFHLSAILFSLTLSESLMLSRGGASHLLINLILLSRFVLLVLFVVLVPILDILLPLFLLLLSCLSSCLFLPFECFFDLFIDLFLWMISSMTVVVAIYFLSLLSTLLLHRNVSRGRGTLRSPFQRPSRTKISHIHLRGRWGGCLDFFDLPWCPVPALATRY